jgi:Pyridoxamine 5'-phosphate oxidase
MTDFGQAFLDVARQADDENAQVLLSAALDENVRAVGPFANGRGRAEVLAALANPTLPLMSMATWDDPIENESTTILTATAPPGLPVSGLTVTLERSNGLITEIVQEVTMAPPPESTPVEITEEIAEALNTAFDSGAPIVLSYVDGQGVPHLSFRGTIHVHSSTEIGLWIRDPKGGLLRAIETNPNVALLYNNPETRLHYDITGTARRIDDADIRDLVFERSPQFEQGLDAARRGAAVLIAVSRLVGGRTGSSAVNMEGAPALRDS